ncbi:helix-turn-helix transcriptional regulator [Mycobacteroides abscessus]|nr:helix-turn-helix transcriptional regulator [Mycobacteroides abscessus]
MNPRACRRSGRVIRGFRPDRLRELRKKAGMSQGEFARVLDVARGVPWYWEQGRSPEAERLPAIAQVLGVSIDELVYVDPADRMPSDLRVRKGLNRVQLARLCGLSTTALSNFERAESKACNLEHAQQIAPVLGVTVDELHEAWRRARARPAGTPA